jgi:hypothetical protein
MQARAAAATGLQCTPQARDDPARQNLRFWIEYRFDFKSLDADHSAISVRHPSQLDRSSQRPLIAFAALRPRVSLRSNYSSLKSTQLKAQSSWLITTMSS